MTNIAKTFKSLNFVYQKECPTWNSASISKFDITTGNTDENIDQHVPEPNGFFVQTGLIDINRFCWGVGNYNGILVYKDDDTLYFNTSDKQFITKMGQRYVNGAKVLGDGTAFHPLIA